MEYKGFDNPTDSNEVSKHILFAAIMIKEDPLHYMAKETYYHLPASKYISADWVKGSTLTAVLGLF